MLTIDRKRDKGMCVAYRCGNKHADRDRFCHKHRKRWQKENNPIVYTFGYLKQNARRRGKAFTLAIEEFKQFCEDNRYMELKGTTGASASIDRIRNDEGYHIGNIQVLSVANNSKKGTSDYEDMPF